MMDMSVRLAIWLGGAIGSGLAVWHVITNSPERILRRLAKHLGMPAAPPLGSDATLVHRLEAINTEAGRQYKALCLEICDVLYHRSIPEDQRNFYRLTAQARSPASPDELSALWEEHRSAIEQYSRLRAMGGLKEDLESRVESLYDILRDLNRLKKRLVRK